MPNTSSIATEFEIGHAIGFLSATKDRFTTIEIIRKILGYYLCDKDVPAGSSPNAQFGGRLSANATNYRIQRVGDDSNAIDDLGNTTTTAIWRPVERKAVKEVTFDTFIMTDIPYGD